MIRRMLSALLSVFLPLAGAIVVYALLWKLAAKILRYGSVPWPLAFLVAASIVFASAFVRGVMSTLELGLPAPIALPLSAAFTIVLGAWCFHDRATLRTGELIGWPGALKLSTLALALFFIFSVLLLFCLFSFTGGLRGTLS